MRPGPPGALIVLSDIMFFGQRRRIAELAADSRLPAIAWTRELAESGVLVTHGPNTVEMHRRAAVYVDKVLKGAKPADLPIEQSGRLELVVNLKTARALGITVPSTLILRAHRLIE
jgi:putative ABC transport system substrate-binding protein